MAAQSKPPGGTGSSIAQALATGSVSFTQADMSYVRRSKRRFHHEEHFGELNIVPYLDIVVNLIMFLLVAQATMVSIGIIDVTAPTYGAAGPGPTADPEKKELMLTLGVAEAGFYLAAKGGVLPGEQPAPEDSELTPDRVTRSPPTIPKKPDGSYDYGALGQKLRAIKTWFPDSEQMYLAADAGIPYEVLVRTLDASREDSKGSLFPKVAFSRIN